HACCPLSGSLSNRDGALARVVGRCALLDRAAAHPCRADPRRGAVSPREAPGLRRLPAESALPADSSLVVMGKTQQVTIEAAGREVVITNPDKAFSPKAGHQKTARV